MSVHYRFKSALDYDTITFDGLHISVKELKNAIIVQKRFGKNADFDLKITNAQTQEVYDDENTLIPKNTSLLVARVPIANPKPKQWEGYGGNDTPPMKTDEGGPIGRAMDLASLDAPEDDKIKAMMSQSTQDYDPSNYIKIRGANQVGPVPPSYKCYKCHQGGHWIKDCPMAQAMESVEIKKSTGIPHSFMIPVEGPQVPGALMMANGQYGVPAQDLQAYTQKSTGPAPVQEPKPEIPEDLLCSICSDLLTDAVMIPCCGNSFCDECIRFVLLESEDHECPDCHEKEISPTTLIPNRFLRKSVANFKNTTGYEKKPIHRPKPVVPAVIVQEKEPPKKELTPPPVVDSTEKETTKEEKPVISEADSTEQGKNGNEASVKAKEKDKTKTKKKSPKPEDVEGPPGVSPRNSPIRRITSKVSRGSRDVKDRHSQEHGKNSNRSRKHPKARSPSSPRRPKNRRSASFESRRSSDRNGTPMRDEPPGAENYPPPSGDGYTGPPGDVMPPGGVMPPMQGPPPVGPHGGFPPGQPPPFHPPGAPPNFRLPPPGSQPPPFMPPGPYSVPARPPVFDPMGGPPGNFGPNYRGREYGRRGGRDRTPPGVIDDPLAAFNRILREKDEKRARQQRMAAAARRSWSRSRSRSFSHSPPPLRRRSRSPRRRSRSRSRSFSISRRRNDRDRNDFDRDYDRGGFRDKPTRSRRADSRDRFFDDRERDRDFDRGSRNRVGGPPAPGPGPVQQQPHPWGYGPPPQDLPPAGYPNRFPQQIHHIQPQREYEKVAPPEVEQPPVPGLESEPPPVNEFEKKKSPEKKERDKRSSRDKEHNKDRERESRDKKETDRRRSERRARSRTRTPEQWRNPSPKSGGTPERPRKRRSSVEPKDEKKKDRDRHRDQSEDEKKKSKDKKKHREKKDKEDKKKRKDKKDKHHHKSKDKKDKKEEFKQVIPKSTGDSDEDADAVRKKIEERKKIKEEEETKRLQEERKKEERRLRFIEDEKKKREEEARKEEIKKKAIEEARRILEEEERLRKEEAERQHLEEEERQRLEEEEKGNEIDLYEDVIPKQDLQLEVVCVKDAPLNIPDQIDEPIVEQQIPVEREMEEGEVTDDQDGETLAKAGEEEDASILELHSDMDIKLDENDILAPMPEKSKWEVEEDGQLQASPSESKDLNDSKSKVSSEVLKRAENVIFARAINSIRPLEIKKIGGERVKIYAVEDKLEEVPIKVEAPPAEKPRLSVKQRLGKKVDDPDPKIDLVDIGKSPSPFNRKDRRIEVRRDRRRRTSSTVESNRSRDRHRSRADRSSDKGKKRRDDKDRHEEKSKDKRKRTRSRSESDDHKRRKKDKRTKKEKDKSKKHEEDTKKEEIVQEKPKSTVEKRKPTLDEASFEPDYDLELHDDETSEIDQETKNDDKESDESEEESSSSESSYSSSEEDRRRRKRRLRKKKKRRETSSSESESSSESSDSDRDRKRKRHKKTKRKKKKSRHR